MTKKLRRYRRFLVWMSAGLMVQAAGCDLSQAITDYLTMQIQDIPTTLVTFVVDFARQVLAAALL